MVAFRCPCDAHLPIDWKKTPIRPDLEDHSKRHSALTRVQQQIWVEKKNWKSSKKEKLTFPISNELTVRGRADNWTETENDEQPWGIRCYQGNWSNVNSIVAKNKCVTSTNVFSDISEMLMLMLWPVSQPCNKYWCWIKDRRVRKKTILAMLYVETELMSNPETFNSVSSH